MPITDYKVTDIERDAVRMEGKADPLNGTLAQNQAEFDEYPELVRDNLDGLCDYIATMPIAYASSAAAATANKGSITGFVPLGGIIELSMTNGNTAVAPTIAIDGVTHTITGMPTTAQVQANSTQTYRLVKTGATALTFTKNPDYVCEYGTRASGYVYARYASGLNTIDGNTYTPTVTAGAGSITSYTAAGSYVVTGKQITVNFEVSITNAGTGSGTLLVTPPITIASDSFGMGREVSSTGLFCSIVSVLSSNKISVTKLDTTTIIGTGYFVRGTITYFI